MSIIEIGGIASGLLAVITLTSKIVKLITTIQTLINRLEQLQEDMTQIKHSWQETEEKIVSIDQRLRHIEYEMAVV